MTSRAPEINDLWRRATDALAVAQRDLRDGFCDAAASRSYYAAFYAASALLLMDDRAYSRHRGVIACVHRDYVRTGRLPSQAGELISALWNRRLLGDYGGTAHVDAEEAAEAVADAVSFLDIVRPHLPQGI